MALPKSIKEVSYERFMKRLNDMKEMYKTMPERPPGQPGKDFPPGEYLAVGAPEKGLQVCEKIEREMEEAGGPENCIFYIDFAHNLPLWAPKEKK